MSKQDDWDFTPRQREASVELEVCAWAENVGWVVRKMEYRGRKDCPDRFFFGFGRIVMVEFKKPGQKPRPSQKIEHDLMADVGLIVHVISDIEAGKALLRQFMP